MLIFNNEKTGVSHQCEIYRVNSFSQLANEAKKTSQGPKNFKIVYYDDQGQKVTIENDDSFQKLKKNELEYYMFEIQDEELKKSDPLINNKTQEFRDGDRGQIGQLELPSLPQPAEYPFYSSVPQIRQTDNQVTGVGKGVILEEESKGSEAGHPEEPAPAAKEFKLVDSKMGASTFGTFSQANFNQLVKESPVIRDLDQSVRDLEDEIRNGMDEVRNTLVQAQAFPENAPKKDKMLEIHKGITCDICRKNPIRGKRYKCIVCLDFDICMACERGNKHIHPVIRLSSPTDGPTTNKIRIMAQVKMSMDKVTEVKRRKLVLKMLAGPGYDEPFYDQFVTKNENLDFRAFVFKVGQIFG